MLEIYNSILLEFMINEKRMKTFLSASWQWQVTRRATRSNVQRKEVVAIFAIDAWIYLRMPVASVTEIWAIYKKRTCSVHLHCNLDFFMVIFVATSIFKLARWHLMET